MRQLKKYVEMRRDMKLRCNQIIKSHKLSLNSKAF